MARFLCALVLAILLVGCGEEKKKPTSPAAPVLDVIIFDKKVRVCERCQKTVHSCATPKEAEGYAANGRCVALALALVKPFADRRTLLNEDGRVQPGRSQGQ